MMKRNLFLVAILIAVFSCEKETPHKKSHKNDYQTPNARVVKLKESTRTWDGTEIGSLRIKKTKVTSLLITIKKGERLPLHKHPVLNVGYLIKGTLTVYKETGEKKILKAGEVLVELINQWHYGANESNEDALILVTYISEKDGKLTILKK